MAGMNDPTLLRWTEDSPTILLIFGLISLAFAIYGTVTGKAGMKHQADRSTNPISYWTVLVVEYAIAGSLILVWLVSK
jgi:hypothetical protein